MIAYVLEPAGVLATPIWVRGHRVEPVGQHPEAALADAHMIARVEPVGPWVDVSRLQFDPDARRARYYVSEGDLAFDWREVNDDPDRNARWRPLDLASPSVGEPIKGLVTHDGALHLWGVDVEGAPHHDGAMRALDLCHDEVATYISLDERGRASFTPEPADRVHAIEKIVACGVPVVDVGDGPWFG